MYSYIAYTIMNSLHSDSSPTEIAITNGRGLKAMLTNYGARMITLSYKDANDDWVDVIVGPEKAVDCMTSSEPYYGAIIGPCANRISNASYMLNNKKYVLDKNNGIHNNHSGIFGWHSKMWNIQNIANNEVKFSLVIEQNRTENNCGFPGTYYVECIYTLTESDEMICEMVASSPEDQVLINMTQHNFYNLNGCGSGSIINHRLQVMAQRYCPIDKDSLPTGELLPVQGSPLDMRDAKILSEVLDQSHQQLGYANGVDHNFVLQNYNKNNIQNPACILLGDKSKIGMKIITNQPCMQVYTGNYMEGINQMKYGSFDNFRWGICLETQAYTNAINTPNFPNIILPKGAIYRHKTIHQFFNY